MKNFLLTASMLFFVVTSLKSQKELDTIKDSLNKWIDYDGDYEKAFPVTLETAEQLKRDSGEHNLTYAEFLYSYVGSIYEATGNYKKAEQNYKEGMKLCAEITGNTSISYAEACANLGNMYNKTGMQHEALALLKEAYDILSHSPGTPESSLAGTMNNLAQVYQFLEQYPEAQKLYNRLLEIIEKDPAYAPNLPVVYNNMGSMYLSMGAHNKALLYYDRLEKIFANFYSPESIQSIGIKSNIGVLKTYNGEFEEGIQLLSSLDTVLQTLKPQNPSLHIIILGKLAGALYADKKYKQAEEILLRAAGITNSNQLNAMPFAKNNDLLLANLYIDNENYEAAEGLLLNAADSVKTINTRLYFGYLMALERLYWKSGRQEQAGIYMRRLNDAATEIYDNNFAFLSSNDKLMLLPVLQYALYSEIDILLHKQAMTDEEKISLFKHCEAMKARLLQDQRTILDRLHASDNDSIRQLYAKWIGNRQYLNKIHYNANAEENSVADSIQIETENEEAQLTRLLHVPASGFSGLGQTGLQEIQGKLKDDEAIIEYVRYRVSNEKERVYEDEYMVMVITKTGSTPVIKKLCSEKDVRSLMPGIDTGTNSYLNKLYVDSRLRNKKLTYPGDKLYALLFKPISGYLKNIRTIYCSTDGLINTIALHALPVNANELMIDRFNIRYISGCAALVNDKALSGKLSLATVWGGIDYNTVDTAITRGENKPYWKFLPASRAEAVSVDSLLENNNITSELYTGNAASKPMFDSLSGKAFNVIHLATHGYAKPSPEVAQYAFPFYFLMNGADENSMLYSGLVLAGANRYIDAASSDKGYIDAYEISAMDFSKAYLVTLSACETAVGRTVNGEGVFGLSRAFALAGAKNIIVSLWQVPDKETTEFMVKFYAQWLQGRPVEEAFEMAERAMKEEYSPYYWAAFKLIRE